MSRWNVPLTAWTEVEVEAESKEEAVKKAIDEVDISSDFDGIEVTDQTIQNLDDGIYYAVKR
jgi:hypothetical protein